MPRSDAHSQHYLRSPKLVLELIGHTNIRKNDTVLDVGAGSGVISYALSKRCKEVVALEPEPRAIALLEKNLASLENIKIIKKDFFRLGLPQGKYKVFANIPFHLSSPIVKRLTDTTSGENLPVAIFLITQRQFARKLIADKTSFTNQLGAALSPLYSVRIRKPLRKTDFTPPPNVDTVLLEIKPLPEPLLDASDYSKFLSFVERCFTDPKFFTRLSPPVIRPSQMDAKNWQDLFKSVK